MRLTEKDTNSYKLKHINWTNGVQRATQKLGLLEDIEEDFGIDLVKLLSAKSIFVDEKSVFYDFNISVIEQCVYLSIDDCDYTELPFDEYGKTWAFTKGRIKK